MIKTIIFFLLILNISNCNFSKKNQLGTTAFNQEFIPPYSSIYLAAHYYVSKGDVYTASKILNSNVKSPELLKLKFFSNLVSGNFKVADKVSTLLKPSYSKNNLYHLPKYILNIKNGKFNSNSEILEKYDIGKSLHNLTPLIQLWILKSENKPILDLQKKHKNYSVHELLILENFNTVKNLKKIAKQISEFEDLNNNDILLLAGFYFRQKDFEKFKDIIEKKLSNKFDKKSIIQNFMLKDNIYKKMPTFNTILASKIYNNSIHNKKQNEAQNFYQKLLLEISLYLCPELDIAKYYLAELYALQKTNKRALKLLSTIPEDSVFFLASSLRKLSIINTLNNKSDYKKLLFQLIKKRPKNKFLLRRLANFYKSKKQYFQSIKIYQKIRKSNSQTDQDNFLYAANLDKIGKWEEAKIIFLNLLEKNPNNTYTLNYVAYKLALKDENLDLALKFIKQALLIDPENGYFLDTLGWVEFKRKNYEKSVFFLEKSVAILPRSAEVLEHLGDCYLMLNRTNEAVFEWKKALKYESNKRIINNIQKKIKKYE